MKLGLLVSGIVLLLTAIPGTANALLLKDPLMELAWRQKRLDGVIQELAVVNSQFQYLESQLDAVMKIANASDIRYLDSLILPESLKRLETSSQP